MVDADWTCDPCEEGRHDECDERKAVPERGHEECGCFDWAFCQCDQRQHQAAAD